MTHPLSFQSLTSDLLSDVTGGAARVTVRNTLDPALTVAMTQIKSDLDSLVTNSRNNSGTTMQAMLPVMMMMRG